LACVDFSATPRKNKAWGAADAALRAKQVQLFEIL